MLNNYVSMWFTSFLGHVQMILMERISQIDSNKLSHKGNDTGNDIIDDQDDEDDAAFADISHELMNC